MKDNPNSERARKILNHPQALGCEYFARYLALQTDLPADQAIGALEALHQDTADRIINADQSKGPRR